MTRPLKFKRLLLVIKQTAYEEYSQLKLRGKAPKALRWKRLESRYKSHRKCVKDLIDVLKEHDVDIQCVSRVELDRQHLADVDLMVAVGGDGTVLSSAHFLDNGTIPMLGVNSDPISEEEKSGSVTKKVDERRSHGALCMCTSHNMHRTLPKVLYGDGKLSSRTRIQCTVKSTFSETRLVPALNDLLIANPSPAAVSRFRMGWLKELDSTSTQPCPQYGTVTRFGKNTFDVMKSINVWSSGMWVCTGTGSSAAMHNAGGSLMPTLSPNLQFLIREHMIEALAGDDVKNMNNQILKDGEQLHLRWNSQRGTIFIDGSHLNHELKLGDEIVINTDVPPLQIFMSDEEYANETRIQEANNFFDRITY